MDIKFISFIVMLTAVLLEAKLNLWKDLAFSQKAIINSLFPKNSDIVRINNLEEAKTNKVATLDFIGLVERHGYPAEKHYVTTEDGYNLIIHRIPASPLSNNRLKKKVIFLQHGILCSSDCWVLYGAGKDLAFLLADQGYDVWLGNVRGNSYCRSHIQMSPQNRDFWQFSYHEIGTRDLPVMIDYVLSYTKRKTLHYIGHSMGTTVLFVLLSMRPEYNAKIKLGICLAPIAMWKEVTPVLASLVKKTPKIQEFFEQNEIYELAPLSSTSITLRRTLCADKAITQAACIAILFLSSGSDPAQFNTTAFPELLSHFPYGASVKTILHFSQNIITHKFESYDDGFFDNYKRYKQIAPIQYNLKRITASLALFYGANDPLATASNVFETYSQLPNVILLEENPYKPFTHNDFLWAIDAKTLIYDRVMEVLERFDIKQKSEWNIDQLIYY
ncbi:hypothetical protein P5V15_009910 [Pogonomyrmex californicus]